MKTPELSESVAQRPLEDTTCRSSRSIRTSRGEKNEGDGVRRGRILKKRVISSASQRELAFFDGSPFVPVVVVGGVVVQVDNRPGIGVVGPALRHDACDG
jgi:hypothetical protein